MNPELILNRVSVCQANDEVCLWAALFFKENQCFDNAYKMSQVDGCDYVNT